VFAFFETASQYFSGIFGIAIETGTSWLKTGRQMKQMRTEIRERRIVGCFG
jgi:hypothetical protein